MITLQHLVLASKDEGEAWNSRMQINLQINSRDY
jgi:hypothetical protein